MKSRAEQGFNAMAGVSLLFMSYSLLTNFLHHAEQITDPKHNAIALMFGLGTLLCVNAAEMCLIEQNLHFPSKSEWMVRTIIGAAGLIVLANILHPHG